MIYNFFIKFQDGPGIFGEGKCQILILDTATVMLSQSYFVHGWNIICVNFRVFVLKFLSV